MKKGTLFIDNFCYICHVCSVLIKSFKKCYELTHNVMEWLKELCGALDVLCILITPSMYMMRCRVQEAKFLYD